jgi:hypothetical protein
MRHSTTINLIYVKHLRSVGEVGNVTEKRRPTIKSKLEDQGLLFIFVGYSRNHAGNIYRMINMKNRKALFTRKIKWTKRFIGEIKTLNVKAYMLDIDPIKSTKR